VAVDKPLRKPPWLRSPTLGDGKAGEVRNLLDGLGLGTVCSEASCPNRGRCFQRGTATFLILGRICTRECRYCAVEKAGGRSLPPPDPAEPVGVAKAVSKLGLRHAVVTSVTRDDLPDGGASHFASTVAAVRASGPGTGIEVLTPDFGGSDAALDILAGTPPDVFNHNLETVERLFPLVRPRASYRRSISLLARCGALMPGIPLKSGLMLGMGETAGEIRSSLRDLLDAGVRILTLGQYLRPGRRFWEVERYLHPDEFETWRADALRMGFSAVASGPLVRSSFDAEATYGEYGSAVSGGGDS
jgi:lipoic acid synthetase